MDCLKNIIENLGAVEGEAREPMDVNAGDQEMVRGEGYFGFGVSNEERYDDWYL
jgi:hypothetical protein